MSAIDAAVLSPRAGGGAADVIELTRGEVGPGVDAYRLVIHASGAATITGATDAGRRAGLHTLRQLARLQPGRLPRVEVEDAGVFATRGVMLDVSRDRVPTMAHLFGTVDLLASLKFNHVQLYTEHTFAYAGHEEAWRDSSAITAAEMRTLDDYCAARGVELSANQNCFGHLAKWLRLPRYRGLAEIERDEQEWRFMHFARFGPFSLCPTEPACAAFVGDLLGQLVPTVRSGRVNIGCDETFDVGWGRSAAAARALVESGRAKNADQARAMLFFYFVGVINAALKRVKTRAGGTARAMMWADIALHHEALLHRLPEDAIGLAWAYEPTDKFAAWVRTLVERGREAWVCPGTSSWRSFTGRTRERRGNIADAAEQGAAAGASGLLVCDWGDVGHRQGWVVSVPALAQAAEAAWNPGGARGFDARAASLQALDDATLTLGPWLEELGDVDAEIRVASGLRNATALFNDLHEPLTKAAGERTIKGDRAMWRAALARLDAVERRRVRGSDAVVEAEIDVTLLRTRLALVHGAAARAERVGHDELQWMDAMAGEVLFQHERVWAMRSRPGGLLDSLAHDEKIRDAIRAAAEARV